MKVAVLTDIHANLVALHRVTEHLEAWHPDEVIMAGDLINRGPRPLESWKFVREKVHADGWRLVRGNHEDYVLSQGRQNAPRSGPDFEIHRFSYWTYRQLRPYLDELKAMPFQQSLQDPDGCELRVVHASMRGNRDGIYLETRDPELAEKIQSRPRGQAPAVFCVGHTHRPLVRSLNGTLVVNAGSAGLPFDGDIRPSYAQLTHRHGRWQARIVRLDYDLKAAERDFRFTGYLEEAGPLVHLVLLELLHARPQLYGWAVRYQERVRSGEMTMKESVEEFREKQARNGR